MFRNHELGPPEISNGVFIALINETLFNINRKL